MERQPDPWKKPTEFIKRVEQLRVRGESIVGRRPPDDRELAILRERLIERKTLKAIGEAHGIGNERVRQLLNFYFGVTGTPPLTGGRRSA
jgi:DNA-directed RNA polymerase sigma subunit (sigma70/sigma32)